LERANAYTHLIAAITFILFACLRPFFLETSSLAGVLSEIAVIAAAITFSVSVIFHIHAAVPTIAHIVRTMDHASIDVSIAVAVAADLAICSNDYQNINWQTIADPLGVAVVILVYFLYRRLVLPPEATLEIVGKCAVGTRYSLHVDGVYGALRSATYVALLFSFVSYIPAALRLQGGEILIVSNVVGVLLLIGGMTWDSDVHLPDKLWDNYASREAMPWWLRATTCPKCGCAATSHSIWHVIAFISVGMQAIARDIALNA
jgi:predicted membrane channel-forming protein YqfA (hemolysin III family)